MDSAQLNAPEYQSPVQGERKKGIPGSTIKIIAVVTMLIDHIAAAFLTRVLIVRGLYYVMTTPQRLMEWLAEGNNGILYFGMMLMRLIGRLGFPIFCFLLVEGFQKTRNIKKYVLRLGLFALISEVPFDLAFSGRVWNPNYQNVYFTLLIGILTLWAFDAIAKCRPAKWLQVLLTAGGILLLPLSAALQVRSLVARLLAEFFGIYIYIRNLPMTVGIYLVLLAAMLAVWGVYRYKKGNDKAWRMCGDMAALAVTMMLAAQLETDYGGMGVLTIAVMYALRKNAVWSMAGGCAVLTVMSLIQLNPSEIPTFLAMIPIARYNGERGLKMKYFFYIFYPAHLLILWLICWAMGMGGISAI